jgi:hypothetical protein
MGITPEIYVCNAAGGADEVVLTRRVDMQIVRTGGNGFRLILDLFETNNVGTGMAREIPGGAEIIFGAGPPTANPADDAAVNLIMNLTDESDAALKAISDWFRGKLAKREGVKIMIQEKEFRFEEGELKKLLETNPG